MSRSETIVHDMCTADERAVMRSVEWRGDREFRTAHPLRLHKAFVAANERMGHVFIEDAADAPDGMCAHWWLVDPATVVVRDANANTTRAGTV